MKNLKNLLLLLLLPYLFAGCASTPRGDTSTEVEKRALKRWELLIAKQAGEAYEYLTPGYRATHPKDAYAAAMGSRPVRWKKADFMEKQCEGDSCTVRIMVTFELRISAGMPAPVSSVDMQTEKWIRVKDQWFHLPAQ